MFFEIPTIWKEKTEESANPTPPDPPTRGPKLKRSDTSGTERLTKKRQISKWRPRRIGLFFAQNVQNPQLNSSATRDTAWTCLVLIEPIECSENFVFCYRKMSAVLQPTDTKPAPNARCLGGLRRYTIEE